jgi:hypothetical protein
MKTPSRSTLSPRERAGDPTEGWRSGERERAGDPEKRRGLVIRGKGEG